MLDNRLQPSADTSQHAVSSPHDCAAALDRRSAVAAIAAVGAALTTTKSAQAATIQAPDAFGTPERDESYRILSEQNIESYTYDGQELGLYADPMPHELAETAELSKRVLVVVDYQVDFVDGGVFGTIEPAVVIEDALCEVIREYQEAGDIVIYTMDTHPADTYLYTREGTFNPPHCIPGTEGWMIYGKARDLLTPDRAIRVLKGTYGSSQLPEVIRTLESQGTKVRSIEFAGVSTTCRVLHNAIILYNFFPQIEMIFDARTTAGYTPEETSAQLEQLQGWGFVIKW